MIYVVLAALFILTLIIGAAIGIFIGYLLFGRAVPEEKPEADKPSSDDIERARKEREELIASQKAFHAMMGYNADIAYGISAEDEFTAGGS